MRQGMMNCLCRNYATCCACVVRTLDDTLEILQLSKTT